MSDVLLCLDTTTVCQCGLIRTTGPSCSFFPQTMPSDPLQEGNRIPCRECQRVAPQRTHCPRLEREDDPVAHYLLVYLSTSRITFSILPPWFVVQPWYRLLAVVCIYRTAHPELFSKLVLCEDLAPWRVQLRTELYHCLLISLSSNGPESLQTWPLTHPPSPQWKNQKTQLTV